MVEMVMSKEETSHCWWFDIHHTSRGSPWLQFTLAELDKKTKSILELIEADADSFAQRAEMYYKKRPELISMVEDFYRAHRSLAESYNQLKSDSGNRLLTMFGSSFSTKHGPEKLMNVGMDQTCDSHSQTCDAEDSAESEVDDPEQNQIQVDEESEEIVESEVDDPEQTQFQVDDESEEIVESEVDDPEQTQIQVDEELEEFGVYEGMKQVEFSSAMSNAEVTKLNEEIRRLEEEMRICKEHLVQKDEEERREGEVMKLREEIERLKEQNRIYKDNLLQKDEDKREVIRQLSLAMEVLKLENMKLRKCVDRDCHQKRSHSTVERLKDAFLGKLFNRS